MSISFTQTLTATLVLFAVIDIIGSIPILLELKRKQGALNAEKASVVSMVIMIAFLFLGERIIHLIGIDVYSFAVAGSFVLLFLALEMILGITLFKEDPEASGDLSAIVPVAFPLIAGAGTMTTLISLRSEFDQINIILAIIINIIFVYLVFKSTRRIEQLLGPGGISIVKKVFGIILLAIAVKLFTSNVQGLFQGV